MSVEPPIELEDPGRPRPSVSSLQRDIEDALREASQMEDVPRTRQGSIATTMNSANSLMTGSSYVDFDAVSRASSVKAERYREKLQKARKSFALKSTRATSRLLKPLRLLKWPQTAILKWWKRRHTLPPTEEGRKLYFQLRDPVKQVDERTGRAFVSNLVTSSIYTIYDFFPRQLIVQFSKMANLYFLFVAILQMVPSWSTTGNYTTIVPLCVFVAISMGREGYEDFNRHLNDKEENNRTVIVVKPKDDGVDYVDVPWKKVKVGDIVRVLQNEWVPADIVLLHSSGQKGQCSIETIALDGETTLKSRETPAKLQEAFSIDRIAETRALITTEDPNLDLFNFEGTFELLGQDSKKVPLGPANVVYRGSALRNTASVLGAVIFTGSETKLRMNASRDLRVKAPKLQGLVNKIVLVLAAYVLLLSGFSSLAGMRLQDSHKDAWYFQGDPVTQVQSVMGFIIMFNTLIPLSLYVSMEICKAFQKFLMQNDIDMYDPVNDVRCHALSTSLNEELGQVSYVFSDKTGTLTDNIMLFRKLTVAGYPWIHDLDMYFEHDEDGYLFHKVRPLQMDQMSEQDLELLEQLARIPRRNFGAKLPGRPSSGRASLGRPSVNRQSLGRPSLGRPSLGRPSTSAWPKKSIGGLSFGAGRASLGMGRASGFRDFDVSAASLNDLPMPPSKHSFGSAASEVPSRPSGAPRPSGVSGVSTTWRSTAEPLKQQTTPSTLTLLEYMRSHPDSEFTQRAHFFLLSIALCHSASPEIDLNKADNGDVEIEQLDYQAASPDELALVAAARDLGYLVIDRQHDSITVRTYPNGFDAAPKDEVYKVLDTIEFSSARKRMSNIVQFPDGRIMLFCKGADNVMIERLRKPLTVHARATKKSINAESLARRSIEAQLANENRSFSAGIRPSLDMLLQRSGIDQSIYEAGRRSMSVKPPQSPHGRNSARPSLQEAVQSAKSAAAANAARTSVSIDMNRPRLSGLRSPRSSMQRSVHRSSHVERGETRSRTSDVYFDAQSDARQDAHPDARQEARHSDARLRNARQSEASDARTSIQEAVQTAKGNMRRTSMSIDMNRPRPASFQTIPEPPSEQLERLDIEDFDERQVLEHTLEKIDEFSTEGLRTLLYCHRALSKAEYEAWKVEYDAAKSALSDRQKKVQEVGEKIEHDFVITGSTAIEDKLQLGVPEAIDKLRRANIRMWMLTGDKQETAVNIGQACRLIKDFSTIITLKASENIEAKVIAALEELDNNNIAHCVVVIDGQTLAVVENDPVLMSLFVDLGLRADSAIVCRASPSQKATIVKSIRAREPTKTMLAIGDGANDIAMIQAADVGIGIAGREGLQAARSADYSIGQFRFLLKLLLVHGRWNYVRTCKYILSTFFKEFLFYMTQEVFQRWCLYSGTSVFESWSIAMFNTLFTSLPVICVGILDQDLSPATLIAVPELYRVGQRNEMFGLRLLFEWLIVAMLECVMILFLAVDFYGFNYLVKDNTLYPLGVTIYSAIVSAVCFRVLFISMFSYITLISLAIVVISIGGYWLFNVLLSLLYHLNQEKTYYSDHEFYTDVSHELCFWAIVLLTAMIAFIFDSTLKLVKTYFSPTDTDVFQVLEKDYYVMRRFESESELELHQGWEYQDAMDHSWWALFRGREPGQPRLTWKREHEDKNKYHGWMERLRLRKPHNYDAEIQEILERRQRETGEEV